MKVFLSYVFSLLGNLEKLNEKVTSFYQLWQMCYNVAAQVRDFLRGGAALVPVMPEPVAEPSAAAVAPAPLPVPPVPPAAAPAAVAAADEVAMSIAAQ